jgi:hypothetical protein
MTDEFDDDTLLVEQDGVCKLCSAQNHMKPCSAEWCNQQLCSACGQHAP